MHLKPNDLPPFEMGESRNVLFKLAGAVGANTIESFSISSTPNRLSFGTPSIDGSNVTVLVNADAAGSYTLLASASLSSEEEVKGRVRIKIIDINSDSFSDYRGGC